MDGRGDCLCGAAGFGGGCGAVRVRAVLQVQPALEVQPVRALAAVAARAGGARGGRGGLRGAGARAARVAAVRILKRGQELARLIRLISTVHTLNFLFDKTHQHAPSPPDFTNSCKRRLKTQKQILYRSIRT